MSAIRRHPLQLTVLMLLAIACGLTLVLRYTVKAQEGGAPSWADADIGAVSAPGNVQSDGSGGYALTSSQSDIWGTNDTFNYLYQPIGTNGQIIALVGAMQGGGNSAKAGVMIRETFDTGSREAMMEVTSGNGVHFQWRSTANGNTSQTSGSGNAAPCWVKLVRSGDWVGGYESADGTNWNLVDWQVISKLAEQVYVGLAVSSGGAAEPASALFDQVSVGLADPSAILIPVIGTGDGLSGSYYPNRHLFGTQAMTRVDGPIDFDWNGIARLQHLYDAGKTNRAALISASKKAIGMARSDQFGVRWIGELQAQFSEPYTIYASSHDGIRVWLNEELVIDGWAYPAAEKSAVVNLTAGQRYLLRVEYFHNHGNANVKLSWSSPSTSKRVIPQSQLYSQLTVDPSGNGLPIYWEEHYFGHTKVDPNADPDGDGLSNLQEYQRHTDPTSPFKWGLPNEWTHGDIEGFGGNSQGEAHFTNGEFTVKSMGHDIWNHHDDFHYVFQTIGTNGEIVARILGIEGDAGYTKAGVMLRESLDDNARDVMLMVTWTNSLFAESRLRTDDVTTQTRGVSGQKFPMWLKIARSGDWVGSYESADGTNWILIDWQTLSKLSTQVFVGMAVATRNPSTNRPPSKARFDNVSVGPAPDSDIMSMVTGTGDGLTGSYQNGSLLYLPAPVSHVDAQVDFDWSHNPPMSWLNPDGYGVCWQGEVQAQFSEPYTFGIQARREDWVRVWVNEKLVINQWRTLHLDGDFKGMPINLVAGQHYLIRVEMYNNDGHGRAILDWSSPSTPERVVPEDQLYSQPQMDPDGSGLPVIWENIYFGHSGVDPNGDPDNDGLSNLQEWQYHTNPTNSDTDGDGLPDAWEIAHGTDPQYPDADLDYDSSGLSNEQDYLLGLNPFNVDENNDGLPDWFEEEYLGTGPSLVCTNQISVVASINGAQATNFLGNWQVDGRDIYCLDRRGGVDFELSLSNADKYVLNLIGTQNQYNPFETSFNLLMGIDNQSLEHYTLNAGYGTNGSVELVLPYLQAGTHVLHVFWDGYASYSSLRIKQVKLLAVSGSTNQDGIKQWAAEMMADESGMDATNPVISSYTSPVCLEGRDPFATMMAMTNSQTNALSPIGTSDGRWYVNVPLTPGTQTVFTASYQNGGITQTAGLQWQALNLLQATNLTIRKGDSLLFNAIPQTGTPGQLQVQIGGTSLNGSTTSPVPYQFNTAGTYTVNGSYTSSSGQTQNGSVTVEVVGQTLSKVQPCAWVGMERTLNLTNLAPEAVLQADSRLTCYVSGTNANGGVQLTLGIDANEPRTILARLGTNGPVLDSTQVLGFDVWSGDKTYTRVVKVYPDKSQLVEMLVVSSPVERNVRFVIQPIVSGITFDDGTTLKTLTATNFDVLGQCPVRFIRPASATTSVCNSITGYQGKRQIGFQN